MNERKLTQGQIEELFSFCRKHNVPHYDLQIELVDHIANSIELNWIQNPLLSFNEALKQAYQSFGVGGFSAIYDTKEKNLRKKYRILQWRYIGEFYRLPKIILTLIFSLTLFTIIRISNNHWLVNTGIVMTFAIGLVIYEYFYHKKYELKTISGKTFLLTEIMKSTQGMIAPFAIIPINAYTFFSMNPATKIEMNNLYIELAISVYTTFLFVVFIAVSVYIPRKMKEDFSREFPQFVKS